MAESKKIKVSGDVIADVAKPGKSAASATSKPIIVANRPVLKDPMMVDQESKGEPASVADKPALPSEKRKIAPISVPEAEKSNAPVAAEESATEEKGDDQTDSTETTDETETDEAKEKKSDELDEATLKKEAERATELEKLVESRKYFLPINQLEKRRSKHYVILGVFFIIILGVAWADVALDSGIITIHGVKAPTHFFK